MGTFPQRKSTRTTRSRHIPKEYLEKATLSRIVFPCSHAPRTVSLIIFSTNTFSENTNFSVQTHVQKYIVRKYFSCLFFRKRNVGQPFLHFAMSTRLCTIPIPIANSHARDFDVFNKKSNDNVHVTCLIKQDLHTYRSHFQVSSRNCLNSVERL